MFFEDSRPDRKKRAMRTTGAVERSRQLLNSPVPPPKQFEVLTDDEIIYGGDRTLAFDVESYPNYFLVGFKCLATAKYIFFEDTPEASIDTSKLGFVMHRFRIVGFNSRNYDISMTLVALQGVKAWKLKEISDEIIHQGLRPWEIERRYGVNPLNINHIDLIEVAPIQASLKIYAGRLHCPRMQDLPYEDTRYLSPEEAWVVKGYNCNDLDNTGLLFKELEPHIELREQLGREYEIDLRSKSDAQVAEAIIHVELNRLGAKWDKPTIHPGWKFQYQVPSWIEFKTPQLQRVLDVVRSATFVIGESGHSNTPKEIEALKIKFGNCVYRMGNGGLHSSEKSVGYVATEDTLIIDRDVASYYPWIIINNEFYPPQLGSNFPIIYRDKLVLRRLDLKERKDPLHEGLKIAINGTFGKEGNRYSDILYAPHQVTQTTITGQLGLLMQIEMVELAGFRVISANTDGIVILCPKERVEELAAVYAEWERVTGFKTEETRYRCIYSRDVNNYIAVKEKPGDPNARFLDERLGVKAKGVFCERGSALNSVLSKNPETLILNDAVQTFLAIGTPIEETILSCTDFRRFISIRQVSGGAEKNGVFLGKAVRWYYAKGETGAIHRVTNGNKIGKTDGARPCMDLPDAIPDDLDYDWYIREAIEILYDIGYYSRPKTASLFD